MPRVSPPARRLAHPCARLAAGAVGSQRSSRAGALVSNRRSSFLDTAPLACAGGDPSRGFAGHARGARRGAVGVSGVAAGVGVRRVAFFCCGSAGGSGSRVWRASAVGSAGARCVAVGGVAAPLSVLRFAVLRAGRGGWRWRGLCGLRRLAGAAVRGCGPGRRFFAREGGLGQGRANRTQKTRPNGVSRRGVPPGAKKPRQGPKPKRIPDGLRGAHPTPAAARIFSRVPVPGARVRSLRSPIRALYAVRRCRAFNRRHGRSGCGVAAPRGSWRMRKLPFTLIYIIIFVAWPTCNASFSS